MVSLFKEFESACLNGNTAKVELIIKQGNVNTLDYNYGLRLAVSTGHYDLIKLMISKGAICGSIYYDKICKEGNIDIVKLIIGSNSTNKYGMHDIGFRAACRGGHIDIINLFIDSKAIDINGTNIINGGFKHACMGGHINIVKLMISKGNCNYNDGFIHALNYNQSHIVEFLLERNLCDAHLRPEIYLQFLNRGIRLFRAILYERYTKKKLLRLMQRDLIPDLLKLLYFK